MRVRRSSSQKSRQISDGIGYDHHSDRRGGSTAAILFAVVVATGVSVPSGLSFELGVSSYSSVSNSFVKGDIFRHNEKFEQSGYRWGD